MINVQNYFEVFKRNGVNFFTGVPDSALKYFASYIDEKVDSENHIITANEGAAIGLASGYHLATGKVPLVYMQNSGLGNAVNPLVSLVSEEVCKLPMLLMIGWRGSPEKNDEPQHKLQGKITLEMLELMNIPFIVLDEDEQEAFKATENLITKIKETGKTHAIVVKRNLFSPYNLKSEATYSFKLTREDALKIVVDQLSANDIVVSTTGKLSRELFEYREDQQQKHTSDFLTVGAMGHATMIALGVAKESPTQNVFCLDGDGAMLMHLGSLSTIGFSNCKNYKHIVFNNGAHESVGGQKTLAFDVNLPMIAMANGYPNVQSVATKDELKEALISLMNNDDLSFLEIKVRMDSRKDLGRPTKSPIETKTGFMRKLLSDEK